jgi:hypothetical protein
MDGHLEELRAQIERVTGELREMRQRLDFLEARVGAVPGAEAQMPPPDPDDSRAEAAARLTPTRTIPLVGRTLVVLGGAFLLRAITDNALVPAVAGAAAGLLYAAWWLVQADRSAAAGLRQSAVFHGFATATIVYPLVWETTARFGLLGPNTAGAALLFFLGLGLAVAWRRDLWEIAWSLTLFSVVAAIALAIGTREFLPFTLVLLIAAVAVELLAYRDRWLGLRWPVALGLDLSVLMLTSVSLNAFGQQAGAAAVAPGAVIAVCMLLPLLFLGSIAARTLLRGCPITPFETTQAAAALVLGFSGAVRVGSASGTDPIFVGIIGLALGAACYAAALTFIDRRSGRGRNFYSYTTLAGLLVLAGSFLILSGVTLALTWSALAIVAIGLGGRFDRITLKFHGAAYLGAAATISGLIACAYRGLMADPTGTWERAKPVSLAVTLVAVTCYGILVTTRREALQRWFELLPRAFVGAVFVWSVGGITAGWASAPIIDAAGSETGPAFVAAARTAVIAILAVTLAWIGRRWSLQELTWFAYPLLAAGGAKLLWEDLHYNQPVTMFLALALYGGALIVTPRVLRTSRSEASPLEAG